MEARSRMELTPNDLELWTLDDAESWKEAETIATSEAWVDDDPVLDNDIWLGDDDSGTLSVRGLGRLGIRGRF